MHSKKILFLVVVGVLCVNARVVKRQKKIRQRQVSLPSCGPPIIEIPSVNPSYGSFGTCNCQNIFLNERPNYRCGCQYVESYGILNPEVSNYGRLPAIRLPKMLPNYDAVAMPAINLPGLYDLVVDLPVCQGMSTYMADLPILPSCQYQTLKPYQFIDGPCNCRSKEMSILEYLSPVEIPSPLLKVPYAETCCAKPPISQAQVIQLPVCGCQKMPCSCDNGIKMSYGLPCGCQKGCGCQNLMPYELQLPMDVPCTCQLSPVELPAMGNGCQSLPPPVIGCSGKYLRQVTLQPPFL